MTIRFEKSAYFKALTQESELNSKEKIFDYVKDHPQLDYNIVPFQRFEDRYESEGCWRRKIVALPAIVWSGVVKTIYHLTRAILVSPTTYSKDRKNLKVHFFYIARDLQESFGWLVTLFSDKHGQYVIQESEFHKSCYDCILADDLQPANSQPSSTRRLTSSPRDQDLVQIAESYYIDGDLDKSLETIDKLYSSQTKEAFIVKIANAYIAKGDRTKALTTIDKVYSDWRKENLLVQIAESYFVEGDLENSLETIDKLWNAQTWGAFIVKIANAYIAKDDRIKALTTIDKLYSDWRTEEDLLVTKENLLVQIAESYFVEGDLEKSLETIDKLYSDGRTREAFIVKVANAYIKRGEKDKAYNATKYILNDSQRVLLLILIAQSYFSENDEKGVLKMIRKIVDSSLMGKMYESGNLSNYLDISESIYKFGKDFIANLARDCFDQTKVSFGTNDTEAILRKIVEKSTDDSTEQAFLNLKTKYYPLLG